MGLVRLTPIPTSPSPRITIVEKRALVVSRVVKAIPPSTAGLLKSVFSMTKASWFPPKKFWSGYRRAPSREAASVPKGDSPWKPIPQV